MSSSTVSFGTPAYVGSVPTGCAVLAPAICCRVDVAGTNILTAFTRLKGAQKTSASLERNASPPG